MTSTGDRLPYPLRALATPRILDRALATPRILDRLHATAERPAPMGGPTSSSCTRSASPRRSPARRPARQRIRHASFPAPKTLEDVDFAAQPGAEGPLLLHVAQPAWIGEAANVCPIGPPGTGKTQRPPRWRVGPAGTGTAPVRDRPAMGRPPQTSAAPQPPRRRTPAPGSRPAAGHRRDRLPAARAPGRHPAVRAHARRDQRGSIIVTTTAASRPGAKSSATRWSPPRSSTGSSTAPP
jgi:hypothetical protein